MGMIGNTLAQGLISGANIVDGTVDTPDLKDSAITTAKVADGAVTAVKLASTAVTDKLGYTPANKAGDTITGEMVFQNDVVMPTAHSGTARFSDTTSAVAYKEISRVAVSGQETGPTGIYFSPDGTKMYVTGSTGDDVNRYNLSTPWDITTAVYDSVSPNIGDSSPAGVHFSNDGSKMFVLGITGDVVRQFSLSPAWDVTTATLDKTFSYLNEEVAYHQDLRFSADGYKMYLGGNHWVSDTNNYTGIDEYTLATAWDIGSPTFVGRGTLNTTNENVTGFAFSNSGTKLWVLGAGNDAVYEFDCSTAWSVITTTWVGMHKLYQYNGSYVGEPMSSGNSVWSKEDGSGFYVLGSSLDAVLYFEPTVQTLEIDAEMLHVTGRIRSGMPMTSEKSIHAKQYVMSDWGFAVGSTASPSTAYGLAIGKRTTGNGTYYGVINQHVTNGTNLSADRTLNGYYNLIRAVNQNGAAYSQNIYGLNNDIATGLYSGNSLNGEGNMFGVYNYMRHQSLDTTYRRWENMYGTYNYCYNTGSGLIDQAYGTYNYVRTGGTYDGTNTVAITTAYGNYTNITAGVANRNITTAYGHYFTASETGTITTKYTFYDNTSWAWRLGCLVGSGNRAVYSDANGILTNSSSDATLKTNVENIQYGVDAVKAMRPVSYNWIDTEKRGAQLEIGFIAQEMQEVVPEVIGSNADGTLSLDYPKLVAVLTKAIQEQQAQIEDLKTRLAALEA